MNQMFDLMLTLSKEVSCVVLVAVVLDFVLKLIVDKNIVPCRSTNLMERR